MAEIAFDELIKAIIAIILVLILVAVGVKVYNLIHPEQFSTEKKDLLRIVSEVKDLKQNDNLGIPILSKNYSLIIANTASPDSKQAYMNCNMDYCACFKKDNQLVICETFNLRSEFIMDGNKCNDPALGDYKGIKINPKAELPILNSQIYLKRTSPCDITFSNS